MKKAVFAFLALICAICFFVSDASAQQTTPKFEREKMARIAKKLPNLKSIVLTPGQLETIRTKKGKAPFVGMVIAVGGDPVNVNTFERLSRFWLKNPEGQKMLSETDKRLRAMYGDSLLIQTFAQSDAADRQGYKPQMFANATRFWQTKIAAMRAGLKFSLYRNMEWEFVVEDKEGEPYRLAAILFVNPREYGYSMSADEFMDYLMLMFDAMDGNLKETEKVVRTPVAPPKAFVQQEEKKTDVSYLFLPVLDLDGRQIVGLDASSVNSVNVTDGHATVRLGTAARVFNLVGSFSPGLGIKVDNTLLTIRPIVAAGYAASKVGIVGIGGGIGVEYGVFSLVGDIRNNWLLDGSTSSANRLEFGGAIKYSWLGTSFIGVRQYQTTLNDQYAVAGTVNETGYVAKSYLFKVQSLKVTSTDLQIGHTVPLGKFSLTGMIAVPMRERFDYTVQNKSGSLARKSSDVSFGASIAYAF